MRSLRLETQRQSGKRADARERERTQGSLISEACRDVGYKQILWHSRDLIRDTERCSFSLLRAQYTINIHVPQTMIFKYKRSIYHVAVLQCAPQRCQAEHVYPINAILPNSRDYQT